MMNKRGVSEIIGYVLLIGIAVGLSALVYNYLEFYIPTEDLAECSSDVSLSLSAVVCDSSAKTLSFTLKNIGLFTVDGYLVRVHDRNGADVGVYTVSDISTEVLPGASLDVGVDYAQASVDQGFSPGLTYVEVVPLMNEDGERLLCSQTIGAVVSC